MINIVKRILKYIISLMILVVITFAFITQIHGNFYQVSENVYRSGLLNQYNLQYYLDKHEIKTVINLRGKYNADWYRTERKITKDNNVTMIDFKMSNSKEYDYKKLEQLVNIFKTSSKPILIHCNGGADRTSLASALYQYAINNKSVEESKKEFAWYYGHLPQFEARKHVKAMDDSFDNYVKYIEALDVNSSK